MYVIFLQGCPSVPVTQEPYYGDGEFGPIVKEINILIAMNQPSMDKFLTEVHKFGVILFDSSIIDKPEVGKRQKLYSVKAADIAKRLGNIKVANSVVLGALFTALCDGYLRGEDKNDFSAVFEEAIIQQFKNKTEVIELNLEAFRLGSTSVVRH